jgi:death-on-curing protein
MDDPHFLTLDEVLRLHAYQIENFGGSEGILDIGLLDSAIAMPRQGFGGTYFHPDLASMAAAYLFHIISNHAFQDGNKRTGVHAALAFLGMNGVDLILSTDEGERVALAVARHEIQKDAVIEFFTRLMQPKE